jgi:hypothetical protein
MTKTPAGENRMLEAVFFLTQINSHSTALVSVDQRPSNKA